MKTRYGRTRSGKWVEVDWGFDGSEKIVLSYSQYEGWCDRVDALSVFEALWVRSQKLTSQQDRAERVGFEFIVTYERGSMGAESSDAAEKWMGFELAMARVAQGKRLLFAWFREGW